MASINEIFINIEDNVNSLQKLVVNVKSDELKRELDNLAKQIKVLEKKVRELEEDRIQNEHNESARKYGEMMYSGGV